MRISPPCRALWKASRHAGRRNFNVTPVTPGMFQSEATGMFTSSPELRLIYKTAPVGLAFLSVDCRYLMINEHLTEICGLSIADHIGRSVRETVPQVADQVSAVYAPMQCNRLRPSEYDAKVRLRRTVVGAGSRANGLHQEGSLAHGPNGGQC
jgi:PAS domain-containing protein